MKIKTEANIEFISYIEHHKLDIWKQHKLKEIQCKDEKIKIWSSPENFGEFRVTGIDRVRWEFRNEFDKVRIINSKGLKKCYKVSCIYKLSLLKYRKFLRTQVLFSVQSLKSSAIILQYWEKWVPKTRMMCSCASLT